LAVIAKVQALVDRGGEFVTKLQAISADVTDKIKPVLAALAAAKPALAKLAQVLGITGGTHSLLDVALRFGEEVLRLDLANVPKETELDLRDTGRRAAGDRVLFRMAAGRRSNPDDIQTLEQREITMHRILSHVTSAVGVNFANPAGQSAVQNNFQAGPAYNLMLKLGLRDSRFWNEFLSSGVGINLTALDFDKDDAQELGLGVGVTLFRDWIQAGYGYDLGDDRAYWYFGLSLPLATFAFGERKP
jgi:RNA 3'-terminal phosphate cyclase